MAQWAVIIPAERWATERLFHSERLSVAGIGPAGGSGAGPAAGSGSAAESAAGSGSAAGSASSAGVAAASAQAVSPQTASPQAVSPRTASPQAVSPQAASPQAASPQTVSPQAASPQTASPQAASPQTASPQAASPQAGDEAVLVAGEEPRAVALGRFTSATEVAYTRRAFDEPAPVGDLHLAGPLTPLEPGVFREVAARLGGDRDRRTWLVSVDMPIEATSPAEAVRQFWSYVRELGPAELPTFVWPSGDELAMQAFVLGQEANQDPEEDDEDD